MPPRTGIVYRIGYQPDPFAWTPWQYASGGRFESRWDDRDRRFRTLYVADRLLGCLLEVLADFRPDLTVLAGLNDIDGDDDDQYPTAAQGRCRPAGCGPDRGSGTDVRRVRRRQ